MRKIYFYLCFFSYFLIKILILFNYSLNYVPVLDSANYIRYSTYSLLDLRFYYQEPLFFAFFLKLWHQHIFSIAIAQVVISVFAWWLLAVYFYKKLMGTVWSYCVPLFLLFFSISLKISVWDYLVLTESLSISLLVLYFYSLFSFLDSQTRSKIFGLALLVAALCFLNQRTSNAYYLLFSVPLYLWLIIKSNNAFGKIIFSLLTGFAVAGILFVSWVTDRSQIWQPSMGNITSSHLAFYPDALGYFSAHGMPKAAMESLSNWELSHYEVGQALFSENPTNHAVRQWFVDHSRGVYARFLITHPNYFLSPLTGLSMEKPNNIFRSYFSIFGSASKYVVWFYSPPKWSALSSILLGMSYYCNFVIHGLFVYAIFVVFYKKYLLRKLDMQVACYGLLLNLPIFLFVWHADGLEIVRHQLLTYLNLTLSLVFIASMALIPMKIDKFIKKQ